MNPYDELRASALRTLSSKAPAPTLNIGKRYPVGCSVDELLWNCQEPMRDLPDDPAALQAEMFSKMHFDPRHEIVRTTAKVPLQRGFPDAWKVARAARFAAGDKRNFWRAAMQPQAPRRVAAGRGHTGNTIHRSYKHDRQ